MNLRHVSNIPRLVAAYTCNRYLWNCYSKRSRWLAMDALNYGLRRHATVLTVNDVEPEISRVK
jgi:hypothetical protein